MTPSSDPEDCQEKASAEIRGEFFRTCRVIFGGDVVGFVWPFSLENIHNKNPQTKNAKFKSEFGSSQPKFTLQGSGLERVGLDSHQILHLALTDFPDSMTSG